MTQAGGEWNGGTYERGEIEQVVRSLEQVLAQAPPRATERMVAMLQLAGARIVRYQWLGAVADLERAVSLLQEMLTMNGLDAQTRALARCQLAVALHARYLRDGQLRPTDLDEAVALQEQALASLPPRSPNYLVAVCELGSYLYSRYERDHRLHDLNDAVRACERGAEMAPHRSRLALRSRVYMARALTLRHGETGSQADLARGLEILAELECEGAVEGKSMESAMLRDTFARALYFRYDREGREADLARAAALESVPGARPGSAPEMAAILEHEANVLMAEYQRSGQRDDLDRAMAAQEKALAVLPVGALAQLQLNGNLSVCLRGLYHWTRDPRHLQRAVEAGRRALAPGSMSYDGVAYDQLGSCLAYRSREPRARQVGDLEEAISLFRKALDAPMSSPSERPHYLLHLANSQLYRYEDSGIREDLVDAVRLFQAAVETLDDDAPLLGHARYCHARALAMEAGNARSGDATASAVAGFRFACQIGRETNLMSTLDAAQYWSSWAMTRKAWSEVAEASQHGLRALHELAGRQLLRENKETPIRNAPGIAARGAYALLRCGEGRDAVVALETGRALMLSEVLERDRADLEDLGQHHPGVLTRYKNAARGVDELERSQHANPELNQTGGLRAARAELDQAVAEIRAIAGYDQFLQVPTFDQINALARVCPVVYLAASEDGGLALIVDANRRGPVLSIRLPALTTATLHQQLRLYRGAYDQQRVDSSMWEDGLESITEWLWLNVMGPLLSVLGHARAAVLVPLGGLGLLPLHAAWVRDSTAPSGRRYALDLVALSYIPNARALDKCRKLAASVPCSKLFAIDEPRPVRGRPLPTSAAEVSAAASWFPHHKVLRHEQASRSAALNELPKHDVYHFSCHGKAHPDEALESALIMARNMPLTLRDILSLKLSGARLAVLSACETAIPDSSIMDETVSLPTGLVQAGVACVMGSLWQVPSIATAALLGRFYQLWRGNGLEPAQALRQAQQWTRDSTNGQKRAMLPQIAELAPPCGLSGNALRFWDEARAHTHPRHWAAFTCVGW
jgi:tetratricopeptide (TPR) repeat protein